MTLWENVWTQVREQMPRHETQRSWGRFFGAAAAAVLIIAIWFPVRLAAELLKLIDLSEKPDRAREARDLFRRAYDLSLALPSKEEFGASVVDAAGLPEPLRAPMSKMFGALFAENLLLDPPAIPANPGTVEATRWRDRLRQEIPRMNPDHVETMRRHCVAIAKMIAAAVPKIVAESKIETPLASLVAPGGMVEQIAKSLPKDAFPHFFDASQDNLFRLSGIPRRRYEKPPKLLRPEDLDNPAELLKGTALAPLLAHPIGVAIPEIARTSHHWIVAGTGAGKTNALMYFIGEDLRRAMLGQCSIVVIDSQHQLIERLSKLEIFAPGAPLDGKLCVLDAADVEYPIAVNLFDMKIDQTKTLSPFERERLMNSALDIYDFIIGSLLQAEMTSRQSTLFRFVTRAMFAIPGANIETFNDILRNGPARYQSHIDTLDETSRRFFATDFDNPQFRQTKEQVIARVWAILGNQTFMRMFSAPRSKFDFFAEINSPGKVILINAEKSLLKDAGTELFGRFFLALLNQAAAQRASLPPAQRLRTYVYVDECQNYIRNDPKVQIILSEARQQEIGLVLAHQHLGQIEPQVLRALSANTAIKMAASLEGGDVAAMARDMNAAPDFIRAQSVGSFAVNIRNVTPSAIAMRFPCDPLARFRSMTESEWRVVRERNRAAYSNPVGEKAHTAEAQAADPSAASGPRPPRDPDEQA